MTEPLPAGAETPEAWIQAGGQHYAAGRLAEAEAATRAALRLAPQSVDALSNLGAILRAQRRPAEALQALDAALAIAPDAADALLNRANLLNDLQQWGKALESADRAVAAAPRNPLAHNARANALVGLKRTETAVDSFHEALHLNPAQVISRFNLAKALLSLGRSQDALALYTAAVAARPDCAQTHADHGHLLVALRRGADAVGPYDRAYDLDPDLPHLAGQRLHARMKACDWRGFDAMVADLARRIDAGRPAATPFTLVTAPLSAARQLHCATVYCARTFAVSPRPAGAAPAPRIRVGYFSADFHEHATAYLMAEMLERHDRQAFEITAFSFGPASRGPMRARLQAACERFFDVRSLDAEAVSDMARQLGLDIAVDLKGFTTDSRPEIFATGAAPIQVNFLGYPMTTGAPFIDYLIADRVLIGPADRDLYSEKVAWLPNSYQPNDRRRAIAAQATTRADHGLAADAFVFASFNGSYKITPDIFAIWLGLLQAVPRAVLWLMQDQPVAAGNLRQAAAAAGVDPSRLVFAPFRPAAEHLERIGHADLFLDSHPCSAHTTASDALWAGLPLLTWKGETFASRVAASVLAAAGLPELAVDSAAEYKAAAEALAGDPARLKAIRARLAQARTSSALFDTPAYVRALEDVYRRMHERRLAGLPPAHLP